MPITYVHTNIIAQDWRALAAFYKTVFACVEVPPERDHSGAWLAQGTGVKQAALQGVHLRLPGFGEHGPTLEIYSYHQMEDKPPPAANRKGLGHLAFAVDDVVEITDQVMQHGGQKLGQIVTKEVAGVGQLTFIYVTDPEGNIIELQTWS